METTEPQHHHHEHQHDYVLVSVYTTSGAFPRQGEERVKSTERVETFLREAAKHLHLTDTTGWVARVGGSEINTSRSFTEDGLTGTVKIQWGPPEGGGG